MITGLDHYKNKWKISTNLSVKPGLEAITNALTELDNPHKKNKFIHIAGTNGKGSTSAFLAAILRQHGMSVGSFFSPCIEDLHDQIQFNGVPASEEDMDFAMERLANVQTPLTDFELLTAAAFILFEKQAPDIVIMETGMGGRLDSTNVIDPEISIISSISLEHTNFLGDTLAEIAAHKAGIIKKWKPVVTGPLPDAAAAVVSRTADSLHSAEIKVTHPVDFELKLKGKHQKLNAALAREAAKETLGFGYDEKKAKEGLKSAFIPNRFEEVLPGIIFDGAHNDASTGALTETIKDSYPGRDIHIVMGLLKDKNHKKILRKLETISDHFTFIDFEDARAMPAEILFLENRSKIKTILNQYDILPVTSKNEVTIVTGSLYLLAILRNDKLKMFQRFNAANNDVL